MTRILGVLCFLCAVPLLQAETCGFDGERSIGEPCTREGDCGFGLTCQAGECVNEDGGVGDAAADGEADATGEADAG